MCMKAAVIGYGDEQTASTRFRFLQNVDQWRSMGVAAHFISGKRKKDPAFWKMLGDSDLIINQKCLFSPRTGRRILRLGLPLVFDFDDAIWARPGKPRSWPTRLRVAHRFRFWTRNADEVWTANQFLAERARRLQDNVFIYPMALDLNEWEYDESESGTIRVGWIGSPGNLRYLERLSPVLRDVFTRPDGNAAFSVFCGARPDFDFAFEHVPYQPGRESAFVRSLDIGLVPVDDEIFSYGKSPVKSLQYMASGAAVIGQALGAGAEILLPENSCIVKEFRDWKQCLEQLIMNRDFRLKLKRAGRLFVETHHSRDRIASEALARMKELAVQGLKHC